MTSKSYKTRTTLWDDLPAADGTVPQATVSRGAWRAPSAVLAGEGARRVVSAMPPVSIDDEDGPGGTPIPRRTNFALARTPWWRPRSTFGRILLGISSTAVLGGLIALGVVTRNFLVRDSHFRIPGASSIQSSGLSEVNRADVLPVFGEDIGRNIFFVPISDRRKQLEAIPWVQRATVMRFLPDRLSVSIIERTPVAFVRIGDQVELADADGVILNMPPSMMAQHHYSFPVVTGINVNDTPAARKARMAVYQRFVAELDQNHQRLTEQVSEIDLSDPEDLRATMPEQGSDILAHFGEDQFLHRLEIYKDHIGEWRQRYPKLIGVDLRYNGEVPLEMAKNDAASSPSPEGATTAASDSASTPGETHPKPDGPVKTSATANKSAKPAASRPATESKPARAAKSAPKKTGAAAQKIADTKKKAAKLKLEKTKAPQQKAAVHKTTAHPVPVTTRQGQ